MSKWSSTKAKQVLAALLHIGWSVKRQVGSHQLLERAGWPEYVFAFHDREEIGPKMLAKNRKENWFATRGSLTRQAHNKPLRTDERRVQVGGRTKLDSRAARG